ncbi:MAG: hypothetical protein KKC99_01855 [Proteobacteria bacterium]|nr:hypothetical protein [Pseudomonadota bacterium]
MIIRLWIATLLMILCLSIWFSMLFRYDVQPLADARAIVILDRWKDTATVDYYARRGATTNFDLDAADSRIPIDLETGHLEGAE